MPLYWTVLAVFGLVLLPGYTLVAGIRRYQISGFRFYFIAHSLQSHIVMAIATIATLLDLDVLEIGTPVIMYFLVPIFPMLPQVWITVKARKTSPVLWHAWANKAIQARQLNWIDRILLPRSVQEYETDVEHP